MVSLSGLNVAPYRLPLLLQLLLVREERQTDKLARIAWAVLAKGRAFELTRTDDAGVVRPA
jgi:hypothetical protein